MVPALTITLDSDKNEVVQQIKAIKPQDAWEFFKNAATAAAVAYQFYQSLHRSDAEHLIGGVQSGILSLFGGLFKDQIGSLLTKWLSDPDVQKAIFDKLAEIITSFFKK